MSIDRETLIRPHWLIPTAFGDVIDELNPRLTEALKGKTEKTVEEKDIQKFICALLKPREDWPIWVESGVNLWKLLDVNSRKPLFTLKEHMHPLQPDIDVLYGPIINGNKSTPLVGIEIKIFPEATGAGVMPKTRMGTGYYTGLDEAIALLTFGLDYVYLWHFVILPYEKWEQYSKKYGEDFGEKLVNEHAEFSKSYSQIMKGILEATALPIGYAAHGIALSEKTFWMCPAGIKPLLAKPNPLKDNITPRHLRELICSKLGIKELGTF
jgi:hypothetical protein